MFQISKEGLIKIVQSYWKLDGKGLNELEKIPDLESSLKTNFQKGLVGDDFDQRIHRYGHNKVSNGTFIQLLKSAFQGNITRALLVLATLSIIVEITTASSDRKGGAWLQGFVILIGILTCSSIAAVISYIIARNTKSQEREQDQQVRVLRNGEWEQISTSLIFVGDLILLLEGEVVPADGLILSAENLTADESAITGQTEPVQKALLKDCLESINNQRDVPSPILLYGTKILSGKALMLVLVVGESRNVQILAVQKNDVTSPLSEKLNIFTGNMSKFGQISALIIVVTLLIRFAQQRIQQNSFQYSDLGDILNFIMVGITVLNVAIPGGIQFALVCMLAYTTKSMLRDNVMVRKLMPCLELMGAVDTICTDCSGTLTLNRLRVLSIWNSQAQDDNISGRDIEYTKYFSKESFQLFVLGTVVNGAATLRPERTGSATEIAQLEFIEKCGLNYETIREKYQPRMTMPFSSKRKRTSIVLDNQIFMKGSSEIILQSCSGIYINDPVNKVEKLTDSKKLELDQVKADMDSRGMRTIAIAYKDISEQTDLISMDPNGVYEVEKSEFILIAILGIRDTIRQEVPRAIRNLKSAGIKVCMMTGDNQVTASAFGKDAGILSDENSIVMEGSEFIRKTGGIIQSDELAETIQNGSAFDEIYPKLNILARCRPEDKYTLVAGLQERGHIVAVTGSGTNDAPALKKADAGIAMGISSTDIARESSDMILLDDNISSVVSAIMWSRNIQESMQKLVQFQSTVIIVSLSITLIGAVLLRQAVLQPIQLLWVNIIIDTAACLAFVSDPPSEELSQRKPATRSQNLISPKMFKHIFGQSLYQLTVLIIIIFAAESFIPEYSDNEDSQQYNHNLKYKYSDTKNGECTVGFCTKIASGRYFQIDGENDYENFYKSSLIPSRHFTLIFNLFVLLQLFNLFNSRKIHDQINIFKRIFQNPSFLIIILSVFTSQVIIVTFGGLALYCYPFYGLTIQHWLICIALASGSLLWDLILKFLPDFNIGQVQQRKSWIENQKKKIQ